MPMFPLQSVLVPGAPLSLHVFEDRYRRLMQDVLADESREFGVVLIERGSEVGGGDVRSRTGTVARIVNAVPTDDGRWGVIAVGTRRIDVAEWLPDAPYPVGNVIDRPDGEWSDSASGRLREVEAVVRRALAMKAELGEAAVPATVELDEVSPTRAWQLVAIAPVATLDHQSLLRIDDPVQRLDRLQQLVDEELSVLAQRMRGL
ncbi:MAG TPA: LON peptidase substrate-binding domain-containing protein [Acidimicrobiales bacterium]|nr:LON peptidase substrate-binding domain-containing protein [Acidimicrobiales bacterium]